MQSDTMLYLAVLVGPQKSNDFAWNVCMSYKCYTLVLGNKVPKWIITCT